MKKLITHFMLALFVVIIAFASKNTYAVDSGDWSYKVDAGVAKITAYLGTSEKITVPSTIDGYRVISLEESVFKDYSKLLSINLPDTLEYIGSYCFENCTNLKSITLPKNLTKINYRSFYNCTALEKITVNSTSLSDCSDGYNGNTFYNAGKYAEGGITVTFGDGVTRIPANIFRCNSDAYAKIRSVTVSDTVKSIGGSAFVNCFDMTSIAISTESALEKIDGDAFTNCTSLSSIYIPPKVKAIGGHSYWGCTALSEITIDAVNLSDCYQYYSGVGNGNTFYSAGKDAADGITVTFGDGVTRIPANIFLCDGDFYARIKSVTLSDTVESIGCSAFGRCYDMTSIAISPESALEKIGEAAFANCTSLSSIYIPPKVKLIDGHSYWGCTALSEITIDAVNLSDCYQYYGGVGNGNTFYNAGKYAEGGITVTFGDGVTRIPANIFLCDGDFYARIKTVTVSDTVESIGSSAFGRCYDMTSIAISPESALEKIGEAAFANCTSLSSIYIPPKVKLIDGHSYWGCTALSEITIDAVNLSDCYQYYGGVGNGNTFYNAGKYAEGGINVIFGEGATRVPANIFMCDSGSYARIKIVTIPGSVKEIGSAAFANCKDLQSVSIYNADCSIYDKGNVLGNSEVTTIYGYANSTAQSYAKKYNYKFAFLNNEARIGDANCDGAINTADAVLILKFAAGITDLNSTQVAVGDCNRDGAVNTADAVLILKYAAGMITNF